MEEDRDSANPRLFVLETPILEVSRSSRPYHDRHTQINRQGVMPLKNRMFERKIREEHGALILVNFQEAEVTSRVVIPDRHLL